MPTMGRSLSNWASRATPIGVTTYFAAVAAWDAVGVLDLDLDARVKA